MIKKISEIFIYIAEWVNITGIENIKPYINVFFSEWDNILLY